MSVLIVILIVITCAALAFFVLIQNPKGGGLAGSFGGLGNQMMGAKQSTDVVEKGTWVSAAVLLVLVLGSFVLTPKNSNNTNEKTRSEKVNKGTPPAAAPTPAQTQQQAPAPTPDQAAPSGSSAPSAAPVPTQAPASTPKKP